ncbi:putative defense protein isoform X1 [Xenia sp. Carnegie-2017]|uniref:putative defense protein isoform X1 n=1 Tax=Xenia sp. Carnegie-2017 TaxID=2897299 RepID=UPI001F033909|nr:putative defense protein isoform X1 [Xenia sp. Carnegie-2017]
MAVFVIVLICLTVFHGVKCRPNGAPSSQCVSMMPNHGAVSQTVASPYQVKVDKAYYMYGKKVNVSIESSNVSIKGFLIQARPVGQNSAIGMFSRLPGNTKFVSCGNNKGAVTHSARLNVRTLTFEWEPPKGISSNISFYATVVKDFSTFWVQIQSPELHIKVRISNSLISLQKDRNVRRRLASLQICSCNVSVLVFTYKTIDF